MLSPLKYLTSRDEHNELLSMDSPKAAAEAFWLKHAGSKERASGLIRNFYNRVEYANRYFSSYKEGWKTDRGMIYIVFGLPSTIYRRDGSERWIYDQQPHRESLNFVFDKETHPFGENHYILQRDESYKSAWYQAVDDWRHGRVTSSIER